MKKTACNGNVFPSLLGVAMLVLHSTGVCAGVPVLVSSDPAEPRVNETFKVVYAAFCEDVFPAYAPSNRIVEIDTNVVTISVWHIGQFCMGQPYIPSYSWDLGPLPAGKYQIELRGYSVDPQVSFPIASGEVTVTPVFVAPQPNVVPTAGKLSLLSLSLLTALLAMWGLRRR